jgi:hypothetical protein
MDDDALSFVAWNKFGTLWSRTSSILNSSQLNKNELEMTTEFADVLAEFLEVAIHQIMYVREVYPRGTFVRAGEECEHILTYQLACVGDRVVYATKEVRYAGADEQAAPGARVHLQHRHQPQATARKRTLS